MANYDNVSGVNYRKFEGDETEPSKSTHEAKIDEMYYDENTGNLVVNFTESDDFHGLEVPVKGQTDDWNEFVESLPRWDS